jgi:hypothetical protein
VYRGKKKNKKKKKRHQLHTTYTRAVEFQMVIKVMSLKDSCAIIMWTKQYSVRTTIFLMSLEIPDDDDVY